MLDGRRALPRRSPIASVTVVVIRVQNIEEFEDVNNIMPVPKLKQDVMVAQLIRFLSISVRRQALALRWLTMFSRKRSEKTMEARWQMRFDAVNNTGASG